MTPRHYICPRCDQPPHLDGRLDDPCWKLAPWTEDFIDIEGAHKPKPRFRTRAKMCWDDAHLYIAAELEEPQVWATLTEHDSVIFHDHDFEVFLDPDNDGQLYTELEMNALNTTWDLLLVRPYRAGGPPLDGWELHGLRTAVYVDGRLNDPAATDRGWSLEIAIPWSALIQTCTCPCPPQAGNIWRINFSRVEWQTETREGKIVKKPGLPEDNWVWSPQGVVDMHRPERWGALQFTTRPLDEVAALPIDGQPQREELTRIWDAQQEFRHAQGRWARDLSELGAEDSEVRIESTSSKLELSLGQYRLDDNQRFWKVGDQRSS
jgi:hypothetical protein